MSFPAVVTSIPTAARGSVRAYIKQHPAWDNWIAKKGVASRDAKNTDLLDFAGELGLLGEVAKIIASSSTVSNAISSYVARTGMCDSIDEAEAMKAMKAKEDHKLWEDRAAAEIAAIGEPAGFAAGDILRSVEQFLSPLVRRELEKALAPVVDAANKPAVEVERIVTQVVTQQVGASGVVVATTSPLPVKTGKSVPFSKLFGVGTSHAFGKREISLWNSYGHAPDVDPFYVVDAVTMGMIATAAESGDYVWQVGPSGSGKTTNPRQFAAYTGRRFFTITCTKHTEVADLIGGDGARGGETYWQDGALIEAVKIPGAVILIDEPTLASPGVQAIFQAITDDSRTYTVHATGEVVKVALGVMFVVADNTNGAGDETGQYAGTHQANAALVNRFRRMVRVDYMSKAQEAKALVNWTGIPLPAAEHVVDFFARARRLPEMEGIVMSLRQMTGFVRTVKDGFGSKSAFEVSVLNKLPATERAAVDALATLDWHQDFEAALVGQAKAPLTNQPSDSHAAHAFDDGAI
jgi:MoxR-like ATPase